MKARLAALGLCAALTSACAPTHGDAYLVSFAAGERAFHAGRFGEAAAAYDAAASKALRCFCCFSWAARWVGHGPRRRWRIHPPPRRANARRFWTHGSRAA